MGRPSAYRPAIGKKICEEIAMGETIDAISKLKGMPQHRTIYSWRDKHPDFAQMFARAREDQARAWADQLVSLIDNAECGYNVRIPLDSKDLERIEKAGYVTFRFRRHHIDHAREMVSVRKWVMSKALPKEYGDRQALDVNVSYEDKDDAELIADLRTSAEKAGVTPEQMVEMLGADWDNQQ